MMREGWNRVTLYVRGGYRQKNHIAIYCDILWDIAINIAIYCEF
jgi:hypothetical protein